MKIIISAFLSLSALLSPAIASYTPPDNGHPDTERGTGTRFHHNCKHRGDSHREGC